ncbi:MAG: rhamnan synthesis F family protein, partial [Clostridia bacterium]|nr:rhamnan synthesis F family protein [Clostridia bacterium]
MNSVFMQSESVEKHELSKTSCCIVVYMFYEDLLNQCYLYIEQIPKYIDVYFVTSNPEIALKVKRYISQTKKINYKVLVKENRGRDIAALLVTCHDFIMEYEYLCFVHDKKSLQMGNDNDGCKFMELIWKNLIGSTGLIDNILQYLENNRNVGLLVPPIPYWGNYIGVFINPWTCNYDNVINLGDQLELKKSVCYEKEYVTMGGAFWCRTDALRPLFEYKWKLEDFCQEPMAADGTISHAIERILGFVALNNGYDVLEVLNLDYAKLRLCDFQLRFTNIVKDLQNDYLINNIDSLNEEKKKTKELLAYCKNYKNIYIYGAGTYGKQCNDLLKRYGIKINGFIVTNNMKRRSLYEGSQVWEFGEIMNQLDDSGIVIAVNN